MNLIMGKIYSYDGFDASTIDSTIYVLIIFIVLFITILELIVMWKIFDKAGEGGWKILIPYYNTYTMCKIINGWTFLLFLIPVFNKSRKKSPIFYK